MSQKLMFRMGLSFLLVCAHEEQPREIDPTGVINTPRSSCHPGWSSIFNILRGCVSSHPSAICVDSVLLLIRWLTMLCCSIDVTACSF